MKLHIAGGCGDQGRNCFSVSAGPLSYIVDAGTSTDGRDRLPSLEVEEIRGASALFLTHSHRDHTGAVFWLEAQGFRGPVIASPLCAAQLHDKPARLHLLKAPEGTETLPGGLSFSWGPTGHCAGAVWYAIRTGGKTAFFSGDYRENDPCYACRPVRGLAADMAVLDGAYSLSLTGGEMRENVLKKVETLLGKGPVLLPVPHHGRGLSLAVYFREALGEGIPFYFSRKLREEWLLLRQNGTALTKEAARLPETSFLPWDGKTIPEKGLYFLTDAQLAREESAVLIERNPSLSVLLTGSVHGYGKARPFVERGRAEQVLWPNHTTEKELKDIVGLNHFAHVVQFHNPKRPAPEEFVSF